MNLPVPSDAKSEDVKLIVECVHVAHTDGKREVSVECDFRECRRIESELDDLGLVANTEVSTHDMRMIFQEPARVIPAIIVVEWGHIVPREPHDAVCVKCNHYRLRHGMSLVGTKYAIYKCNRLGKTDPISNKEVLECCDMVNHDGKCRCFDNKENEDEN